MEFIDYYAVLGVPKTATPDEIQKAYRKLARQYHPDVNKAKDAEEKFKQVGEAYDVLHDAEKRAKYDAYGAAWKQAENAGAPPPGSERFQQRGDGGFEFHGGSGSFSDLYEFLFGRGGFDFESMQEFGGGRAGTATGRRGRRHVASPGADQEARLGLTLEEAARGGPARDHAARRARHADRGGANPRRRATRTAHPAHRPR